MVDSSKSETGESYGAKNIQPHANQFFFFCYVELDSIAGFTATFTRMIIPSSTCVPNMVISRARKPYMKFDIEF